MNVLESKETIMRGALTRQLGQIVDEIILLDAGEHWTQQPGDTLGRIVVADLGAQRKTIRQ